MVYSAIFTNVGRLQIKKSPVNMATLTDAFLLYSCDAAEGAGLESWERDTMKLMKMRTGGTPKKTHQKANVIVLSIVESMYVPQSASSLR